MKDKMPKRFQNYHSTSFHLQSEALKIEKTKYSKRSTKFRDGKMEIPQQNDYDFPCYFFKNIDKFEHQLIDVYRME